MTLSYIKAPIAVALSFTINDVLKAKAVEAEAEEREQEVPYHAFGLLSLSSKE